MFNILNQYSISVDKAFSAETDSVKDTFKKALVRFAPLYSSTPQL